MAVKKISVIIPTYSPSIYIQECLNSISRQIFNNKDYEVIIVLNGPREPYWTYVNRLLNNYAFDSKLVYTDIPGVSNARNIGLKYANGEYIAFIDDDDYISNYYLQGLYEQASENVIVVCNVRSFGDSSRKKFFLDNWLEKHRFKKNNLCQYRSILSVPWAKLIPFASIGERMFDVRFANGEDSLFITSLTNRIKKLKLANANTIYFVRIRKGSASRKKIKFTRLCKDSFLLIKEYIHLYIGDFENYNFFLFMCRIPGVVKNFFILLNNH